MAKHQKSDARMFLEKERGAPLTFGALMRSVRDGGERTLEEMAQALGVSRAHLCDVEQGRRRVSAERAARWAEALGYPTALFVQLALQDEVNAAGLKLRVDIEAA